MPAKAGNTLCPIANYHARNKSYRERVTRGANPSVSMIKICAANAQAGSYQEPKIGDLDKRRKGSVDSGSLGCLPGLLEQMKSSNGGNRCYGDQPVCNRRKANCCQQNSNDAK